MGQIDSFDLKIRNYLLIVYLLGKSEASAGHLSACYYDGHRNANRRSILRVYPRMISYSVCKRALCVLTGDKCLQDRPGVVLHDAVCSDQSRSFCVAIANQDGKLVLELKEKAESELRDDGAQ
jgi:hypothetical protein